MQKALLAVVLSLSCSPLVAQTQTTAPASAIPVSPQTPPPASPPEHTLLDGTPVKLRLSQTISSADARAGQEVPFEVLEDVKVDDVVVLPKGALAMATVTEAEHKRTMGRGGKLNVAIKYARLSDNERAMLRALKEAKGGSHVGAMTGAMVATSVILWPVAPFFLFMHGKDITIPEGTEITAFADGDMRLDMTRFGAAPTLAGGANAASAATPAVQVSLIIDSAPPGADIEIDGAFVGNTPSTLNLAPGNHQVVVKKKGFATWTKSLTVSGGSVHLSAELERVQEAP